MSADAQFVFALTAIAAAMMASNRVRFDLVAMIVVLALVLSGVQTPDQALSGFGSTVVIMVAGLLIIGEMLDRTGVARSVGDLILKKGGGDETRLLVLLMIGAAILGSVMSSTAIVAIFIPIIVRIASETGLAKSRLLLPMSYAALISGMLTLIATPPNLVVSDSLVESGFAPLGFFSFFPIGAAILMAAIAYFLLIGKRLLGEGDVEDAMGGGGARSLEDIVATYRLGEQLHVLRVDRDPKTSIDMSAFSGRVKVLARRRPKPVLGGEPMLYAPGMEFRLGDQLLVVASAEDIDAIVDGRDFSRDPHAQLYSGVWISKVGAADIMVHPEAREIGHSIAELEFAETFGLEVLAGLRGGKPIAELRNVKLKAGDRLLVAGGWDRIDEIVARNHEFVLVSQPGERRDAPPAINKFAIALAILAGMVALSVFNIVPVVVAVILAAVSAIAAGTMSADQAYRSIHWSSIVLVAGMLPLADAMQSTGASQIVVDWLLNSFGEASPYKMMAVLFVLTAGLSLVLSNTASAVLVAPIAIVAAENLGVSPYPLAVTVLIAASAAFSSPVATPVVTLVVAPGGYSFADFLKVGLPLTLVVGVITVFLTPLVFPL